MISKPPKLIPSPSKCKPEFLSILGRLFVELLFPLWFSNNSIISGVAIWIDTLSDFYNTVH
jgi:hypothetical protein